MRFILLIFCVHFCLNAAAQQKNKKEIKVLLVGTFHFDNPGLDVAKFKDADILSPKRQAEVEEVVRLLKVFSPDKIFIEAIPSRQLQIDSSFAAYKIGKRKLGASEVDQLGFRLAKLLGLSTLYGVDYHEAEFPFDSLMKSAMEAGQTDITDAVQKTIEEVQISFNEALQKSTIKEMLLRENSKELMNLQHEFYFKLLAAGRFGNHVGSYLVSEWWRRNMVIYENILKQVNEGDKKIMVIFGSGHTAILGEIMKYNPEIKLVTVSEVLQTGK
jgi:hypothetical protein